MCPEIIIMSTMTQALFNSGDEKWRENKYYWKR